MNAELLRQVWQRAQARCEYCRLPSALYPSPFQIDHIIAQQHAGPTAADNLALSCIHCNRFKGPNIARIDPDNGEIVRLFHPRRDIWAEHFVWDGPRLEAPTPAGRATIALLRINDAGVVAVRAALQQEGAFGE